MSEKAENSATAKVPEIGWKIDMITPGAGSFLLTAFRAPFKISI
jgi:hypothetical protein